MEPFGRPDRVVTDRGGEFKSEHTERFFAKTGIELEILPPHSPNLKPHIERFFGTLKNTLVPLIWGSTGGMEHGTKWSPERIRRLPTIELVREEVQRWLDEKYHRTIHSETGEEPVQRWRRTAPAMLPIADRDLDLLLLYHTERVVTRGVVRLTLPGQRRCRYYAPELMHFMREPVTIRHIPDDTRSVLAYDVSNSRFIAELWNLDHPESPFTAGHVLAAWKHRRSQDRVRALELSERLRRFHEEHEERDRARSRRAEEDQYTTDAASRKAVEGDRQVQAAATASARAAVAEAQAMKEDAESLVLELSKPAELLAVTSEAELNAELAAAPVMSEAIVIHDASDDVLAATARSTRVGDSRSAVDRHRRPPASGTIAPASQPVVSTPTAQSLIARAPTARPPTATRRHAWRSVPATDAPQPKHVQTNPTALTAAVSDVEMQQYLHDLSA